MAIEAYEKISFLAGLATGRQMKGWPAVGQGGEIVPVPPTPVPPSPGGDDYDHSDPEQVYEHTRPAEWLTMPTPAENEAYFLIQGAPDSTVELKLPSIINQNISWALGTSGKDGTFIPTRGEDYSFNMSSTIYVYPTDWALVLPSGVSLVLLKISAKTFTSPGLQTGAAHVVEIAMRGSAINLAQNYVAPRCYPNLRYFSIYGSNNTTNDSSRVTGNPPTYCQLFESLNALITVRAFDTSKLICADYLFYGCVSLMALPELDFSNAYTLDSTFSNCYSLRKIPCTIYPEAQYMGRFAKGCMSLETIDITAPVVISGTDGLYQCYGLKDIHMDCNTALSLDTYLPALEHIRIEADFAGNFLYVTGFTRAMCIELFESLKPSSYQSTIIFPQYLSTALSDEDIAIATDKGYKIDWR